jgi:hypothetical protein
MIEGPPRLQRHRALYRLVDQAPAKPRYRFVVVHTYRTVVGSFAETVAYRADEAGEVVDWCSLARWGRELHHQVAIRRAGFQLLVDRPVPA